MGKGSGDRSSNATTNRPRDEGRGAMVDYLLNSGITITEPQRLSRMFMIVMRRRRFDFRDLCRQLRSRGDPFLRDYRLQRSHETGIILALRRGAITLVDALRCAN